MALDGARGEGVGRIGQYIERKMRQAKRIFHLMIGLLFLFLAVAGAGLSFQLWREHQAQPQRGLAGFDVVASFTVALIIFGLYTFAKARSVR